MSLTVVMSTSRDKPQFRWFLESLIWQSRAFDLRKEVFAMIVDLKREERKPLDRRVIHLEPKPTPWQGKHRLVDRDWWAVANARNTAIINCRTDWIAFVDDRSVLGPEWMTGVVEAMNGGYGACGPYEKVRNLRVQDGKVISFDETDGKDNRLKYVRDHYLQHKDLTNPYRCPGEWWYGCSNVIPLEWALQVNGYDEHCDGASGEDCIFGKMLENNGFPLRYDTRMMLIEDRTPGECGPTITRADKGISPDDKSHWLVNMLKGEKRSKHPWDIRKMHDDVMAGKSIGAVLWPTFDPYDGEPLVHMKAQ